MVEIQAVWHGTTAEATDLLNALGRNCACPTNAEGQVTSTCAAHRLLLDQRAVDHLVFARRLSTGWLEGEWIVA